MSVSRLIGRLVGRSFCHNFLNRRGKLHFQGSYRSTCCRIWHNSRTRVYRKIKVQQLFVLFYKFLSKPFGMSNNRCWPSGCGRFLRCLNSKGRGSPAPTFILLTEGRTQKFVIGGERGKTDGEKKKSF